MDWRKEIAVDFIEEVDAILQERVERQASPAEIEKAVDLQEAGETPTGAAEIIINRRAGE